MNRSNFLKSLFVLAASPKVISEIDFAKKITIAKNATIPVLALHEKMAVELLDDIKGFQCWVEQELLTEMKRRGFNMDKDFDIEITQVEGIHGSDHKRNLVTIIATQ